MKKLSLLASYLQFDLLTTDAGGVNLNLGWFSAFNSSCWWDGSVSPVTEEGERPAKRFDQAWPPPRPGQIPDSYHDRWTRTARLSSQRSDLLLKPLRRAEPSALSGTKENTERCDLTQNIPAPTFYPIFQVEVWIRALGCSHLSGLVLDMLRNDFVTFSKSSEAHLQMSQRTNPWMSASACPLLCLSCLHFTTGVPNPGGVKPLLHSGSIETNRPNYTKEDMDGERTQRGTWWTWEKRQKVKLNAAQCSENDQKKAGRWS